MFSSWPYESKPLIVFWETTKACLLKCKHCRAKAIKEPLPGELSTEEGFRLIDQVKDFGKPYPMLIFTGGDPLMRNDIWELIRYSIDNEIKVSIAPSVTPLLNKNVIKKISEMNLSSVSISLDSPYPEIHDSIRGIKGTWKRTIWAIKEFIKNGVKVQVNSVIMRSTVNGLADMVSLLKRLGIITWEVFYLIPTGRATREEDLTPQEWEDVSNFLYEASKYGIRIRTTEGPMFRRVSILRRALESSGLDPDKIMNTGHLYWRLIKKLRKTLGSPKEKALAHTIGTRDGRGIIFVSYNGNVYPSGFLPLSAGNISVERLADIYRRSQLFKVLRSAEFKGRCGKCEFKNICGGSRARAYAYFGDIMAEDPSCSYVPSSYEKILSKYSLNIKEMIKIGTRAKL